MPPYGGRGEAGGGRWRLPQRGSGRPPLPREGSRAEPGSNGQQLPARALGRKRRLAPAACLEAENSGTADLRGASPSLPSRFWEENWQGATSGAGRLAQCGRGREGGGTGAGGSSHKPCRGPCAF